ncbi:MULTISPECIES: hypothetical protein [unclassified Modicisalibacter]|uniref:hypothetical protein n=1 Tax=unclassified Modicisalibacter TaxID=2679913 RepID=UPI001CCC79B8|nr:MULTISPECIES: hypothetical protein [unclassified Modicisalibacter]MBZ9559874.1 hypothetical protein [Modicisalibacter sp. R2A 31.J]MBZ9577326.1 hypothetical protein [Modicisalibacter sp. MOD 31.J]
MQKTRLTAALFAALLAGGPIALAQAAPVDAPCPPPMAGPQDRLEVLFDSWHLDDATRQAFDEAQRHYREQRQSLRQAHHERLAEILSAEQLAALDTFAGPHRDGPGFTHRGPRDALRGPAPGPGADRRDPQALFAALFKSWNLSDDQRARLQTARDDFRERAQALRARDFDSRDARHQAWQQLMQTQHDTLADVLDADQMAVLEQLRPPHDGPRPGGPTRPPKPE